jgi:hypothetical protein
MTFGMSIVYSMLAIGLLAQGDSSARPFSFQAYAEAFYSYDFNQPDDHERPSFLYNFDKHNQPNINFALLKGGYQQVRFRANLALAAGTYVNSNYAAEPDWAKPLFEANVGFKLMKQEELWIDAGVFASHIGFESAIGKDNYSLTRSLCAEGTPYYESGVKLGYTTASRKWLFSLLYLNGWQHIQRPDNASPAFGTQITFTPNDRVLINSSSFFGNELPDSAQRPRLFHNLFSTFVLADKWNLIAAFDIGWQQQAKPSSNYDTWYNPTLVLRFKPTGRTALSARAEYFSDKAEVINTTSSGNGFETFGWSVNADWQLGNHFLWRAEYRSFNSNNAMFMKDNQMVTSNAALTTSLCLWW